MDEDKLTSFILRPVSLDESDHEVLALPSGGGLTLLCVCNLPCLAFEGARLWCNFFFPLSMIASILDVPGANHNLFERQMSASKSFISSPLVGFFFSVGMIFHIPRTFFVFFQWTHHYFWKLLKDFIFLLY